MLITNQLTAKLRTRLNYAMVKVDNGWESKTINEVETLAAQRLSPRIPPTSNGRVLSNSPTIKTIGSPERMNRRVMFSPNMSLVGKRSPDSLSSSSGISDAGNWGTDLSPRGSAKPSLAPPVDLGPRNPRRSNPSSYLPPSTQPRASSNVSTASIPSSQYRVDATPPSIHRPLGISRLSQKPSSAMEQDAIETLMFMSSPGNTQYRSSQPSKQQQQQYQQPPVSTYPGTFSSSSSSQPRRSKLSVPTVLTKVPNTDSIPISPRKQIIPDGLDLGSDHNIDKVLDQMSSESAGEMTSSDEDEIGG